MNKIINILFAGVGGQGIVSASDIIAEIAMAQGLDVKKSEIHGMSQRGGVVHSFIRAGEKVYSPLPPKDDIDLFVAMEQMEALRWRDHINDNTAVIVNTQKITPLSIYYTNQTYPDVKNKLKHDKTYYINGIEEAEQIGDARVLNSLMIGALSYFTGYTQAQFKDAFIKHVNKNLEKNLQAFDRGKDLVKNDVLLQGRGNEKGRPGKTPGRKAEKAR